MKHRYDEKNNLQTAFNIQLSRGYKNIIYGFYHSYINKPKMLNDILPLADPKLSSTVRGNGTVCSRSVTISYHSYKLSFLL